MGLISEFSRKKIEHLHSICHQDIVEIHVRMIQDRSQTMKHLKIFWWAQQTPVFFVVVNVFGNHGQS